MCSGLAVSQEKIQKAKKILREKKPCKQCKKKFVNLFTHVKQTEKCRVFYKRNREFLRLKDATEKEGKFRSKTNFMSDSILDRIDMVALSSTKSGIF